MPDSVLLASLEQTPKAVAELAPLVEYTVCIDNDAKEPRLCGEGGGVGGWREFSGVWRDCFLPERKEGGKGRR